MLYLQVALSVLSLLLTEAAEEETYFANWAMVGGRPQEPTCVDIPQNMPLCSGIDYTKMRLPNLLEHDTLKEAQHQAGYWVPLLNLQCHPDTQLFLCSLFTPVCLESPIYPCRSLCEAVRSGCESRMQTYSFPWPEMLRCDKFPLDNDMCITIQHTSSSGPEIVHEDCESCSPVETYENILDNYCRADFVVRSRIKRQRRSQLITRRPKVYKSNVISATEEEARSLYRRPKFSLKAEAECCSIAPSKQRYLIMARQDGTDIIPTFVMPIKKSKALRQAMKMFNQGLNCSDPNLITKNLEPTSLSQEPPERQRPRPKGRRKDRKGSLSGGKRRKNRKGGRRRGRTGSKGKRGSRRQRPTGPAGVPTPARDIDRIADTVVPRETSRILSSSQPEHINIPTDIETPQPTQVTTENGSSNKSGRKRQGKRRRKGNKASRRERRKKLNSLNSTEPPPELVTES